LDGEGFKAELAWEEFMAKLTQSYVHGALSAPLIGETLSEQKTA
jgi:hypothetical protein